MNKMRLELSAKMAAIVPGGGGGGGGGGFFPQSKQVSPSSLSENIINISRKHQHQLFDIW